MSETWVKDFFVELLLGCLAVAIPIITRYIKQYVESAIEGQKAKTDSTIKTNILTEVEEAVSDSVTYVSQVFVDSLKSKNEFTEENQKQAFNMALENVLSNISQNAQDFIEESYGDINNWLTTKIEAVVNRQKNNK